MLTMLNKPKDYTAVCFSVFGCPACGAKHKYGHDRDCQTCYRCGHEFEPDNGRLYEQDRIIDNVPVEIVKPAKTLWQKFKMLLTFDY